MKTSSFVPSKRIEEFRNVEQEEGANTSRFLLPILSILSSLSTELVANAVTALGKAPLDVEMRAADPAGAAFQAAFVVNAYAVFFQFVNIGRANI